MTCHKVRVYKIEIRNLFMLCIDVVVFHAGTRQVSSDIVTSGGRVLAVSAYAPTIHEALEKAYTGADRISFEGKTYRKDIGHR